MSMMSALEAAALQDQKKLRELTDACKCIGFDNPEAQARKIMCAAQRWPDAAEANLEYGEATVDVVRYSICVEETVVHKKED